MLDHVMSLCLTFKDPSDFPQRLPHLPPASCARGASFSSSSPSCVIFWVCVPCSSSVSLDVWWCPLGSDLFSPGASGSPCHLFLGEMSHHGPCVIRVMLLSPESSLFVLSVTPSPGRGLQLCPPILGVWSLCCWCPLRHRSAVF